VRDSRLQPMFTVAARGYAGISHYRLDGGPVVHISWLTVGGLDSNRGASGWRWRPHQCCFAGALIFPIAERHPAKRVSGRRTGQRERPEPLFGANAMR